jgi:hypothetical protein
MAIVANTFTRYDAVGLREELSDMIYNISPMDTPLISGMSKQKCSQTLFEWQTDSLAAAATDNQVLEGDDISSWTATAATSRVGNYTQIARKLLILSGTEEVVNKAGRKSELAYQIAKRGKELKRDMEANAWENIGGVAGATDTIRKTATLGAWIKTNDDFGGSGASPTYTSGVPSAARTDGTQRAFTTTILENVASLIWVSGGTLKNLFVGSYVKGVVSDMTTVVSRNFDIVNAPKASAIIGAVDVYVTDFGVLAVRPSRFQRGRDAWYIDFDYLALRHLRPFRVEKMAKTGDAHKRMLLVEYGIQVKNEAALGLAADLSTS